MKEQYIRYLTTLDISGQAFKVLLALNIQENTQSKIQEELNIKDKAQVNKIFKELNYRGLIEITKVEGRNKFYKAITDIKRLSINIPGQRRMF